MKKSIHVLLAFSLVLFMILGCSKKNDEPANTPTDSEIAMQIYTEFGTVFSQLGADNPKSPNDNINQTVPGPAGGSVAVTGTVNSNQTTGAMDWTLSLNWNNYKSANGGSSLTMNGQMDFNGNVGSTSVTEHFSASNFTVSGTINGKNVNATISYSYDVTMNLTTGHGSISGNISGRNFNYTF